MAATVCASNPSLLDSFGDNSLSLQMKTSETSVTSSDIYIMLDWEYWRHAGDTQPLSGAAPVQTVQTRGIFSSSLNREDPRDTADLRFAMQNCSRRRVSYYLQRININTTEATAAVIVR